ncbi:MAG: 50S ribosomal protein L35 [Bacillota bacterium]|jgi:large subunit ribosomal protein L35|nr:50S ribosomal protein L35 [Bacillota bacterium]
MPGSKLKTHKGAAKRLKVTGTGKVKRYRANATHKFVTKSAKRRRRLRRPALINKTELKRVRRLLPYM